MAQTTAAQQQVFVAEEETHDAAITCVLKYMALHNLSYAVSFRECDAISDQQLGRTIALNESNFGAFVFTSKDNETYSKTSRKRGLCVKFFSVVYSPCPA